MILSREEIQFFQSITTGPEPLGLWIPSVVEEKAEEVCEKAVSRLQEKKILDEQKKITPEGMVPIRLWEAYRNAPKHLLLNELKIALLPERRIITIREVKGDYELKSYDAIVLILEILKAYEFLRGGEVRLKPEEKRSEKCPYEAWQKELSRYGENQLLIGSYQGNAFVKEEFYYWEGEEAYQYLFETQRRKRIQAPTIRKKLLRWFEIENLQEVAHG